jgi:hypothetical protein
MAGFKVTNRVRKELRIQRWLVFHRSPSPKTVRDWLE